MELHGFGDTSELGYGCIYLRASDQVNNHTLNLLCAKFWSHPFGKLPFHGWSCQLRCCLRSWLRGNQCTELRVSTHYLLDRLNDHFVVFNHNPIAIRSKQNCTNTRIKLTRPVETRFRRSKPSEFSVAGSLT